MTLVGNMFFRVWYVSLPVINSELVSEAPPYFSKKPRRACFEPLHLVPPRHLLGLLPLAACLKTLFRAHDPTPD